MPTVDLNLIGKNIDVTRRFIDKIETTEEDIIVALDEMCLCLTRIHDYLTSQEEGRNE